MSSMFCALVVLVCLTETPAALSTDDLDQEVSARLAAEHKCGPVSLWYCLRKLGRDASVREVVASAPTNKLGISIPDLVSLGRSYGLRPRAIMSADKVIEDLPVPSILVIDSKHAIVYEGRNVANGTIRCFDPAVGEVRELPSGSVSGRWTGEAVIFATPQPASLTLILIALSSACLTIGVLLRIEGRRKRREERTGLRSDNADVSPVRR